MDADGPVRVLALERVVQRRVQQLSPDARQLLAVIAVNRVPIAEEVAFAAANLSGDVMTALAELRSERLVRAVGGPSDTRGGGPARLETYHDRIWEAVAADLSAARRVDLHGRIAVALEAAGDPDPQLLTLHLEGAGQQARAAHRAVEAAERAFQALAFQRAAWLYRRALELGLAEGSMQRATVSKLHERLADALASAGHGRAAALAYLDAVDDDTSPRRAAELRMKAANEYVFSGHLREGRALIKHLLHQVGISMPRSRTAANLLFVARRLRIRLRGLGFTQRHAEAIPDEELLRIDVCDMANATLYICDPIYSVPFQPLVLRLALDAGEPHRVARALVRESTTLAMIGQSRAERIDAALAAARAQVLQLETPELRAHLELSTGACASMLGHWRAGVDHCDQAERLYRASCSRTVWQLTTTHIFLFLSLTMLGEAEELARRLPRLLEEADERGNFFAKSSLRVWAFMTWLAADDPEEGRRQLEAGMQGWSRSAFQLQHFAALVASISLDLYTDNPAAAAQLMRRQWPVVRRSNVLVSQIARVILRWYRALVELSEARAQPPGSSAARELLHAARRTRRRIARENCVWASAVARSIQASEVAAQGQAARAVSLYASAAEAADGVDMAGLAAVNRRRQGQLVGGDEGAAVVTTADAVLAGLGVVDPVRMAAVIAPGRWG